MSLAAMAWAMNQTLPSTEKLALVVLASYADPADECAISLAQVAGIIGAPRATTLTALASLWIRGHVVILAADDAGIRRYRLAVGTGAVTA